MPRKEEATVCEFCRKARVSPSIGQGIQPFQLMVNAKGLPTEEFAYYTFVFR
jgi:hypothetical protein